MREKTRRVQLSLVFLILGLVCVLIPFYLVVITSLKDMQQVSRNFFALPVHPSLKNYITVLTEKNYFRALFNTVVITVCALLGCIIFLPMCAYPISRKMGSSRLFKILYIVMVAGIFIPLPVKMMPLVSLMSRAKLMNPLGMVLLYLGSSTCDGVYLFVGYLASIPKELEEAAYIDGARTPDVFFRVIYPLLKPMISTIVIKNGLWFWNDYLLPSLILTDRDFHTLTLFLDRFKTEYYIDYTLVFAAILLTMLPMLLLYIFMQKQFIGGLTGGAVKG